MKRTFSDKDKPAFLQNRSMVVNTLKSIENNFFARTRSYLDEIVNPDNSTNNQKTHAFAKRLVAGIRDELSEYQRDMYESFLYCAFICMERNLLPSFENIVALAKNTEIYGQSQHEITPEELGKDKFLPRFGLLGIVQRLSLVLENKEIPEGEYALDEPSYYDFCRRFGYGTYCHAVGQDYSIREDNSDEIFYEYRDEWEAAIAATVPDTEDFCESCKNFIGQFYERRQLFKAADIEKMIDIFLFTEGKSVLSTTSSRLDKLISDLRRVDADIFDERDLLEQADELEEISPLESSLSIFDMIRKQDAWINDSTRYINDMLSGMNINFHELIVGSTPEETDKRIRRLIEMIEKNGIDNTWYVSSEEREMLRCFLYCAMWESLAIREKTEYSTVKCETFGELLHRADMAVHFYRYSNAPLTTDLLGGTTRTVNRKKPSDTEVHFEHDDDENAEFDAELFDKNEYAARAERLREILRERSKGNDDVTSYDYNSYLYEFQSLISAAVKAFLYSCGLTAFSFGNDFEHISQDISLAIHKIEKVTNQMRFSALQRTYKAISQTDSE